VPNRTCSCWSGVRRDFGKPYGRSRSRKGGGPGRTSRALENVVHGVPNHRAFTRPARRSLKMTSQRRSLDESLYWPSSPPEPTLTASTSTHSNPWGLRNAVHLPDPLCPRTGGRPRRRLRPPDAGAGGSVASKTVSSVDSRGQPPWQAVTYSPRPRSSPRPPSSPSLCPCSQRRNWAGEGGVGAGLAAHPCEEVVAHLGGARVVARFGAPLLLGARRRLFRLRRLLLAA
jgi:hypothetical protein